MKSRSRRFTSRTMCWSLTQRTGTWPDRSRKAISLCRKGWFSISPLTKAFMSPLTRISGLADGTVRFAKDDVVNVKILPAYTRMLTNRGRYLTLFNQHERAILAFKEALALDPNLGAAQQGLAESRAKITKP